MFDQLYATPFSLLTISIAIPNLTEIAIKLNKNFSFMTTKISTNI